MEDRTSQKNTEPITKDMKPVWNVTNAIKERNGE